MEKPGAISLTPYFSRCPMRFSQGGQLLSSLVHLSTKQERNQVYIRVQHHVLIPSTSVDHYTTLKVTMNN